MKKLPDPTKPLGLQETTDAFDAILDGAVADSEIAAFLVALSDRGETPAEIACAAEVLRRRMLPIAAPDDAIDVCGTGGDGAHSLNISTAVTFVLAACGVPVAKHGNRAASSRSGAADVLIALGWDPDQPFDRLEASLAKTGVAFLFAPRHHPALARVAPIRRALARRTIFNLLGPLANPAGVKRQMIGVFAPDWAEPVAEAAVQMGAKSVLAVHGGGLDEIAVHSKSLLARNGDRGPETSWFDPAEHGLGPHPITGIAGGSPEENAAELKALLAGNGRPAYHDIVVANAAGALTLAGRDWPTAIAEAHRALAEGAAADRLAQFLSFR